MKINNYYLLIFAFIAVSVKWYVSFYLFSESLDTKIIHDSVSDAKYYYPLIKFLSEFNLNYSYDPEITNLRSVPLPFWGIFFHSIFLKIFGFYSFIILDFIFIYLILLVFFYIFNVFLSREISIVFSIFIFLIPYLISTSSLNDIQYLNLFSKTLYGLRVPRPMVTNLYFFTFLLLTLKLVTSKFHNIKIFFSLGLITALSLSSFYYHFFTESIMLLVILISKFKTNLLIELKKNFKYYLVFILTFLFFSTPFFLNLYFHEAEFTIRQCIFDLNLDLKKDLLKYFFGKYFSFKGIIFIGFISILTLLANKFIIKDLDKKIINIFYILFLSSLGGPLLFILISPKSCVMHHFVSFIILNGILYLIIYSIIFVNSFLRLKYNNSFNYILIFLFISFFSIQEFNKMNLKKNDELYSKYREEFNLVTKKIEKNLKINEISLLTFDTDIMVWSIMKNIKYLDLIMSIFSPKKDSMIEEDIFASFKKLGLGEKNFELFTKNRLHKDWRYLNLNMSTFFYYKYQANPLITFNDSNDFEKDELERIKNTHLLLQQQQIVPKFEIKRLQEAFTNFDKELILPQVIVLNISNNFYDNENLSLNEYCKVFDGQFYLMYFKNENQNCNN